MWNEIGMFNVTEQRLIDQKNNILKRKCLGFRTGRNTKKHWGYQTWWSRLESNEDEGSFLEFDYEGQDVFMKECEVVLKLHGVKYSGGKKYYFCNEDEYADYEQGHDLTVKNCNVLLKLPTLREFERQIIGGH